MDSTGIFEIIKSIDGVDLDVESNFISASPDSLLELAGKLKNDKALDFDFLMCITAIDDGDSKSFTIVYNFHSNKHSHSCEVRTQLALEEEIPSLSDLWKAADWHEREAYDMMGILFKGHPDLKRILLPQDWEGYPLRKDYQVADYYHGVPIPKDKSYWE